MKPPPSTYRLLLVTLAAALCLAPAARGGRAGEPLFEPSPLRLVASGVEFRGRAEEPGDVLGWLTYKGKLYADSNVPPDGFVVKDLSTGAFTTYQPLELALSAGWLDRRGRYEAGNNIWGVRRSREVIWMGSHGFGVLAFDTRDGRWSRHDARLAGAPGERATEVVYADDEYIFVSGFNIYSVARARWLRLAGVARRDVERLGTNLRADGSVGPVAVSLDLRRYASAAHLPLPPHPYVTKPDEIRPAEDGAGYVFRFIHSREDNGAPETVFRLRRAQLEAAFRRAAP